MGEGKRDLATPFFEAKSPNVTTVTRVGLTGDWCIQFSEAIPLERRKAAVVGAGYSAALVANLTGVLPVDPCPGGISIVGYAGFGTIAQANNAFTFVVP